MHQNKSIRRSIRKRSFLLFELLIALALITLCLFPLLKPHAAIRNKEMRYLEEIEFERVGQAAFCRVKELLYEKHHSLEALIQGVEGRIPEEFKTYRGKKESSTYTCTYKTEQLGITRKNEGVGLLLEITLDFYSLSQKLTHSFKRTLFLRSGEG